MSYATTVVADGADSYWRMNEPSGNAADSVGSVTATAFGGLTYGQTGPLSDGSTAILLDGSTGFFSTSDVYDFAGLATCSIEFWINLASNHATEFSRIISKEGTDGGGNQGWFMGVDPANQTFPRRIFVSRRLSGVSDEIRTVTQVTIGTWYHIAFTYDGTDMRIYVNGLLEGSPVASSKSLVNHGTALMFGRRAQASQWFLNATLSNIAIYNEVLTPTQIDTHWDLRNAGPNAVLSGTAVGGITEADLVSGGKVITVTLSEETWIPN